MKGLRGAGWGLGLDSPPSVVLEGLQGSGKGKGEEMASLRRLQRARVWDPPCACGKEVFYSEEAAWAAIRAMSARRLIQYGRPAERDVYECPQVLGSGVYHLTSNDGRQKNHEELRAARAEREQFK